MNVESDAMGATQASADDQSGAAVRAMLAVRKQAVEQFLATYFEQKLAEARQITPEACRLLDALRIFVLSGGKRIRASLVAAGYLCFAEEPRDNRLVIGGAAVELLHGFLLAHDDVFDRDAMRHGVPTLHHRFTTALQEQYATSESGRYGTTLAILAGDVAAMLAFDTLAACGAPPECVLAASRVLARVAVETGYGEALDVLAELEPSVDEAKVFQIHRYKTAKYTIEGPLHIGALLAGAPLSQLRMLTAFAVPLGIAYQLQDDILGVFGSERKTGKPVGADLREGKRTLLSVHAAGSVYAAELVPMVGNATLQESDVLRAQDLLRRGGSLAYSEAHIARYVEEAQAALAQLDIREEARLFLRGLVHLLIDRAE